MDSIETRLRDAKLGAAIDNAAAKLPDGWQVTIAIERGGYSVGLYDPIGNDCKLDGLEDLGDDIEHAVQRAIAAESDEYA